MATLTEEQERQIDEAMAHARDWYDFEIATSAYYLAAHDLLMIVLRSGQRLAIPIEDLQDLSGADRNLVAQVEITGLGSSLSWPALDVDFSVVGLGEGLRGNEKWMERLSKRRLEQMAKAS